MKKLIFCLIFFIPCFLGYTQKSITADQTSNFIGKNMTVCGKVVSAKFSTRSKGQPTFLNLDKPYPNQIFTVLIWGSDRDKFNGNPEILYDGKNICVTGLIKDYKGKPEIIVTDPKQIIIK